MSVGEITSSLGLPNASSLTKSPSGSEFLGDEEATSICPLLSTPSPPAVLAYDQELSIVSSPDGEPVIARHVDFEITDDIGSSDRIDDDDDIQHFSKPLEGDDSFNATASVQSVASSSSSSSAQEPTACVQLLGPHHHYQQLTKVTENGGQENGVGAVPLTFDQFSAGGEYCFISWNWPVIRRLTAWTSVSVLIAGFCVAIAMIATLPKVCEPDHSWWQEATVYEVFPASFQDSDNDGVGDLAGLTSRVGYLHSLGIGAVRLNSVFRSQHYPEGYENPDSLTEIDPALGTVENMRTLVKHLHANNISLILDLPVNVVEYNSSGGYDYKDPVANALQFWCSLRVDGFYLLGLEKLESDPNLNERVDGWRQVVGQGRVLITPPGIHIKAADLVHVTLDVSKHIRAQIEEAVDKWPMILWSLGHSGNERLADKLPGTNNTVGALLLLMSLPGTPSLLYGDEIGLKGLHDPLKEHEDLQHMRQLAPMAWASNKGFTSHDILPWLPTAATLLHEDGAREARHTLSNMAALRMRAPQLYMNTIQIAGEAAGTNFIIRYSDYGVIAVERWFPRRHVIVTVSNLGAHKVQRDLSSLYYGGRVVVGYPVATHGHYITFRNLILESGETLVVELDK